MYSYSTLWNNNVVLRDFISFQVQSYKKLEIKSHSYAQAPFFRFVIVKVVKSAHIFNSEKFEYVMNSDAGFHVGLISELVGGVVPIFVLRKCKQIFAVGMFCRIVFVAQ